MICPLCRSDQSELVPHRNRRSYFHCFSCSLIFLDPHLRLSPKEELERYQQHRNDPRDLGYRDFLSRLSEPTLAYLKAPAKGLDFGCGPSPVLAGLFQDVGHQMEIYDPFFFNQTDVLKESNYDFVLGSEVVEHFHSPVVSWQLLISCVRRGGIVAVMTSTVVLKKAWKEWFFSWYYADDPTHVCFYSDESFDYLANQFGLELLDAPRESVRIFRKRSS